MVSLNECMKVRTRERKCECVSVSVCVLVAQVTRSSLSSAERSLDATRPSLSWEEPTALNSDTCVSTIFVARCGVGAEESNHANSAALRRRRWR
mmetsp:Transcript_76115/g.166106  ORF Transcript_76115/g.166106 Transcript_76115/m.166106 type:complete len:94 (+) Transcript_76115:318-599(+)